VVNLTVVVVDPDVVDVGPGAVVVVDWETRVVLVEAIVVVAVVVVADCSADPQATSSTAIVVSWIHRDSRLKWSPSVAVRNARVVSLVPWSVSLELGVALLHESRYRLHQVVGDQI
jgi:hypothetical protein